jgi:HSP20 family protein
MMDRMFENAFVMPREGSSESWGGPAVDVYEDDDTLVVEAYAPGINPEAIDVQVERGVLTIRGEIQADAPTASKRHYLLREHPAGRFTRSMQLPTSYTADPTEASYHNGVLRLVFPKAEEAKPRRISVSTGGATALTNGQDTPSST